MNDFNQNSLVENIRILMSNNNITQEKLAEIIGSHQSNISKYLKPDEKPFFTLAHVVTLAEFFNVTTDELLGLKKENSSLKLSAREIAYYLTKLLVKKAVSTTEITIDEIQYLNDNAPAPGFQYPYAPSTRTVNYQAIYFPNYDQSIRDINSDDLGFDEIEYDYLTCGNHTRYQCINSFLNNLLPILSIYKRGELPEDVFNNVVSGLLSQLDD